MTNRIKLAACMEGYSDEDYILRLRHTGETVQKQINKLVAEGALFIDFHGDFTEMRPKGILDGGTLTYVISPVDTHDKFSKKYVNCTGVVAVGTDKETGETISLLSHQDPCEFLPRQDFCESFTKHLRLRLGEIQDRALPGTLDAVIVGGLGFPGFEMEYIASICFLRKEIFFALGFLPDCVTGPMLCNYGSTDVGIQTASRRIYISRPHLDKTSRSYNSGKLESSLKQMRYGT